MALARLVVRFNGKLLIGSVGNAVAINHQLDAVIRAQPVGFPTDSHHGISMH